MDAKEYLSQAHTIDMRINSKMDLLNDWIGLYQRTLRIKSSIHTSFMREPDSMTGVLSQLEDSAETTLQEVNTLADTKAGISAAIDGVEDVKQYTNLDHLDAEILRTFIKRIVVTDTMPGKKGKGIEVKLEYTFDGEYKTYPSQQNRKTA